MAMEIDYSYLVNFFFFFTALNLAHYTWMSIVNKFYNSCTLVFSEVTSPHTMICAHLSLKCFSVAYVHMIT